MQNVEEIFSSICYPNFWDLIWGPWPFSREICKARLQLVIEHAVKPSRAEYSMSRGGRSELPFSRRYGDQYFERIWLYIPWSTPELIYLHWYLVPWLGELGLHWSHQSQRKASKRFAWLRSKLLQIQCLHIFVDIWNGLYWLSFGKSDSMVCSTNSLSILKRCAPVSLTSASLDV